MVIMTNDTMSSITTVQVESAMAMRSLAPQIKAIQQRYAGDQVTIFPILYGMCY